MSPPRIRRPSIPWHYNEETWAVRCLVVETSNWRLWHQVLIAPPWIEKVSWTDRSVSVNVTRQALKHAPAYNSSVTPSREQEICLHQHHGRVGYGAAEGRLENPDYRHVAELALTMSPKARC